MSFCLSIVLIPNLGVASLSSNHSWRQGVCIPFRLSHRRQRKRADLFRHGWQMASHEFSSLTTKLLAGYSASARNATVCILDVTHSLHGVPVANNGFAGGLWAGGYDRSISIASNFAGGSADENVLLNRVKRYPVQAPRPSPTLRIL